MSKVWRAGGMSTETVYFFTLANTRRNISCVLCILYLELTYGTLRHVTRHTSHVCARTRPCAQARVRPGPGGVPAWAVAWRPPGPRMPGRRMPMRGCGRDAPCLHASIASFSFTESRNTRHGHVVMSRNAYIGLHSRLRGLGHGHACVTVCVVLFTLYLSR